MRIAMVSPETSRHRDAPLERRLRRLTSSLADRGHDVDVFCARWWDGEDGRIERDGVTYHAVAAEPSARASFLLRAPVGIARAGPDVVHASAARPPTITAASVGASLARTPLVAEWYDADAAADGWLARRALSVPERIVTPSRMVRTRLREHGAAMERLQVVPNSVDLELIRDVEPGSENHVVYARRLDEGANLESLLLGLAELRDYDWSATVIGDGPMRSDYERQARDLRIDDRLTFAGTLPREDRVAVYRSAHVFVQTARRCQFATELLWALACGCVGIVEYHADSSAHELVEGRERGFRTTSEQELADAIREAGDMERRTIDEEYAPFDRDAVLERHLEIYRELQEQHGLL